MRLLSRFLIVIAGLLAITLLTVLFVVPQTLIDFLTPLTGVNLVVRLVIVLLVDVAILALIYVRLRPRTVPGDGLVVQASGAMADVSPESAKQLILSAVTKVPDVTSATADLKAVRGRADIELDVTITGDHINIPNKQQEINRALKQVVNKQLGLSMLGRPRVHIRLNSVEQPAAKPPVTEQPKDAAAPPAVAPSAEPATEKAHPPVSSISSTARQTETETEKPEAAVVRSDEDAVEDSAEDDKTVTPDGNTWLRSYLTKDEDTKN